MDLLGKVRALVGALVHKPFEPRREVAGGAKGSEGAGAPPGPAQQEAQAAGGSRAERPSEEQEPPPDSERVADLIARKRRDAAG
jgi:hypothetical protein